MKSLAFPLCATALALVVAGQAQARDYGQHGAVWPVIEPDLLAQIHARLLHLEATGETAKLNEELKRRTIARVNRPTPVAGIGLANAVRRWSFDPTITVDADIKDDKGRTVIARGTRVNPLDMVQLSQALVFINGDDAAELAWAVKTWSDARAKIIFVSGSPFDAMKPWQRRFYFDQGGTLTGKFGIRHTPAVVSGAGSNLKISEFPLPLPAAAPAPPISGGGKVS